MGDSIIKATDIVKNQTESTTSIDKRNNKPIGFLRDGYNDKSSKRLQSFIGLFAAIAMPFIAGIIKEVFKIDIPVVEITLTFLVYSAAMQGVVLVSERLLGKQ
jgi:hypothetical protein